MISPHARIFAATWLAYAGYYLTRKNLPVVQPALMSELSWTTVQLGIVVTTFQLTYAVGQLAAGALGDRIGARRLLLAGMTATALLSFASGFVTSVTALGIIWAANGLAQATGWPAVVKTMTRWFPRENRGRVMGFWTTSYQAGDAIATWITAAALSGAAGTVAGWRWGFWIPALALAVVMIPVMLWQRNEPAPSVAPLETPPSERPPGAVARPSFRTLLASGHLWGVAVVVGAFKFIMYTLFFWAVTYLVQARGFAPDRAGFVAAFIPMGGMAGAVVAGWASDRLFGARRMPVAVFGAGLLAVTMLVAPHLGGSPLAFAALFAVAGFATYAPESLLAAAGAVELVPEELSGTAVGFVNAVASIAAVFSGIVGAVVAETYGWNALFGLLAVVALAVLVVAIPMWGVRGDH